MRIALRVQGGSRAAGPAPPGSRRGKEAPGSSSLDYCATYSPGAGPGAPSRWESHSSSSLVSILPFRPTRSSLMALYKCYLEGSVGKRERAVWGHGERGGRAAPVVDSGVFGLDAKHCVRSLGLNDLRMRGRWMYSVSPP